MPVFDFAQLGSNLLLGAAAARRALTRDATGRTGALGPHSVQTAARSQDAKRREPASVAVPRKGLLSRLVQIFQGRASSRITPLLAPPVRMGRVPKATLAAFRKGLDKARTEPESLVQINAGPKVAATFKKDLSRSNYFLADRRGRACGEQINVLSNDPTDSQLASAANSILARLGNDVALFEQVTQFAQQGGLIGLPAMQRTQEISPVKLNGRGVYVMDAAGGGRTDQSHKTYAIGLSRPGVAVVNVRYSNQNIESVMTHHDGNTVDIDRRKSRLDLEFTVEIQTDGRHRIIGNVRLGSIVVPAPAVKADGASAVAGSAPSR